ARRAARRLLPGDSLALGTRAASARRGGALRRAPRPGPSAPLARIARPDRVARRLPPPPRGIGRAGQGRPLPAQRPRPASRRRRSRGGAHDRRVLPGGVKMAKAVLAIDQGTTGTTALVLDRRLAVKGKANFEFRQIFPKPGQVEHDLEDIWTSTQKAIAGALREAGVKGADL